MNRNQVADLFEVIDTYSPGFASEDRVQALAAVWFLHLEDVDPEAAVAMVHAHYANETRWVMPADIRRRVARTAGVLPPDADTGHAQVRALLAWHGPIGSGPDPARRPAIHPAVEETVKIVGGVETAAAMNRFDWRAAYAPRAAEFTERTLAPGGIQEARAAIEAERPAPKPAIEAAPEPGTAIRAAGLRARRAANMARLDESIAELGEDAGYLLPKGMALGSRFAHAALAARLDDYGYSRDPAEAMRLARLEIARHNGSRQAADLETARAAALRACETMMEAERG